MIMTLGGFPIIRIHDIAIMARERPFKAPAVCPLLCLTREELGQAKFICISDAARFGGNLPVVRKRDMIT